MGKKEEQLRETRGKQAKNEKMRMAVMNIVLKTTVVS